MFKKGISLIITILMAGFMTSSSIVSAKNISYTKQTDIISKYQAEYFNIIKRNNVLLQMEDTAKLNADRQDLENLFTKVKMQITNERYLNKYNKIQKRYSQCDGITTIEINTCADKNYKAINKLLDDVYKKAESKLDFENSKNLAYDEIKWEKDVEDYKKVFDSIKFGTIGTSVFYSYEINMKEFRTLLLMLYL